jgi:hypothetical protein
MLKNALNRASRCCSEIPVHHLGTIFSHSQFFSHDQTVSRFMFTSSAVIQTVNLRSDRKSYLTSAVLSPVRVAALLIFNNGSAFRKYNVPAKGLCS